MPTLARSLGSKKFLFSRSSRAFVQLILTREATSARAHVSWHARARAHTRRAQSSGRIRANKQPHAAFATTLAK
eukprot:1264599-Pleurochrysis_carterae.AAC.4